MLEMEYDDGGKKGGSMTGRAIKRVIDFLTPMYFARSKGPRAAQLRETAYLDGLRGFAAFIVYWHHHQLWPRQFGDLIFENAFGYEGRYYLSCFPLIRTFVSGGHFAVAVFFIISGYVLSAKPIQLIYSEQFTKFGDNIASALFRRWMRLYISLILTTFVYIGTRSSRASATCTGLAPMSGFTMAFICGPFQSR
jgi:peptidoglycan/LPS O-acetylase OafA/YrhL